MYPKNEELGDGGVIGPTVDREQRGADLVAAVPRVPEGMKKARDRVCHEDELGRRERRLHEHEQRVPAASRSCRPGPELPLAVLMNCSVKPIRFFL